VEKEAENRFCKTYFTYLFIL